ncbi:MAG: PEGA domain-containing protein [Deltaproteobacteria bacterium]|nr:PEGA domain-containing protein [Deltaproteobacteria bacterium]
MPGLPHVEEATPSGDWTMIPTAEGPTIIPRTSAKPPRSPMSPAGNTTPTALAAATPGAPGAQADGKGPTGDWTIARVDDAPDGWSAPAKVEKPRANVRLHTGPPVATVSGEKALAVTSTAKQFEIEEATKSGLKVEIDETLSAPSAPLRGDVSGPSASGPNFAEGGGLPLAPNMTASLVEGRHPSRASGSFPSSSGSFSNADSRFDSPSTMTLERSRRRRRLVVILVTAAVAVAAGVVLLFGMGGTQRPRNPAGSIAGSEHPPKDPTQPVITERVPADAAVAGSADAPQVAVVPPLDAAVEVTPSPDAATGGAAALSGDCSVEIASSPAGLEVVHDKASLGVTPTKVTLPCGVVAKLTFRKAKYVSQQRMITPAAKGSRLRVALARPTFSVKVSSSPPGATITAGGRSLGVTPTVVKLPAFDTSTLLLKKPGFTPETHKIAPKQNNQTVHAALKKAARR